ncbi:MAG: sugar ABC transporter ATP-binding protein [Sphaerochaeta sp.]
MINMNDVPIVEFRNITKAFSGVKALDDVSFSIKRGTVHCLLGENGAGKSTLIKILTGVVKEDEGQVFFNGEEMHHRDIWLTRAKGIGTVFQENSLIPHLSIAENVFLSRELRGKGGLIDRKEMEAETIRRGNELGITLNPRKLVKDLSVAEQQVVEIVKMFSQNPQFVILDEPTSSLSDHEIRNLFDIIRRMQERGVTFIYISHRMEEIQEIGNDGSILRDGKYITEIEDVKKTDLNEIITHVVGRPLTQIYPHRDSRIGKTFFEVKNLTVPHLLHDINFSVKRGEVIGFSGLVGSGRTETAKAIFGELKKSDGEIYKDNAKITINNPVDAIRHGIGFLTENRKEEGLFLTKSLSCNIVSAAIQKIKKNGILNTRKEQALAHKYVDMLNIKTPGIERPVKYLSGGNQQKVVFGKWLCAESEIYIFDEPTRGIDVGAKSEIYRLINTLAAEGNAIIVISSELPEILGICDRIVVFREGKIMTTLDRSEATQEKIMFHAMGGSGHESA